MGAFGTAPTVTASYPLKMSQTVVKTISKGTGPVVSAADALVEVNHVGINMATGETFDSSFERGGTASFTLDQVVTGFAKAIKGQTVGSRVLVGMTGEDGYDAVGGNAEIGINLGDSLLFVLDIVSTQLTGPHGTPVAPVAGLPTVIDANGVPTVTIPAGVAPSADLKVHPLIKGDGAAVTLSDDITVNYVAVNYADGKIIESTFGQAPESGSLLQLIPAWRTGLVDQTVGSRVLIVSPPSQAYPKGNATPSIQPGTTIVYVVDILYRQAVQ